MDAYTQSRITELHASITERKKELNTIKAERVQIKAEHSGLTKLMEGNLVKRKDELEQAWMHGRIHDWAWMHAPMHAHMHACAHATTSRLSWSTRLSR